MRFDSSCQTEIAPPKEMNDAGTCTHCHRTFKSAAYLVSSSERVLCVACYERLIDPYPRLCCDGSAF